MKVEPPHFGGGIDWGCMGGPAYYSTVSYSVLMLELGGTSEGDLSTTSAVSPDDFPGI